jgi:hypothetical protein
MLPADVMSAALPLVVMVVVVVVLLLLPVVLLTEPSACMSVWTMSLGHLQHKAVASCQ